MNPEYDPDWPEPDSNPRYTRSDAKRDLALAFVCYAVIAAAAFFCNGCATDSNTGDVRVTVPAAAIDFVTNIAARGASAWSDRVAREDEPDDPAGSAGMGSSAGSGASSGPAEPASSPVLEYRFGGFKGGKSVEDPRCRLSSPKITADSIRYKWETKAPSDWARNKTESGNLVVAAAFFWDEDAKKWVGGKFEWTDESRSSRSCANIYEGYGGWEAAAWEYAKKRAFCVVSADGKYRSNLLED